MVRIQLERSIVKHTPTIAIVGGGLAGLTCCYKLKKAGIQATVFEASGRIGGRCWTLRDTFSNNQFVERGGEFISSIHSTILGLIQELGLTVDDLLNLEGHSTNTRYFVNNNFYNIGVITRDYQKVWGKLQCDLAQVGPSVLYNNYSIRGFELDNISVDDWINDSLPGGVISNFGQLLKLALTLEYGAETNELSALHLLQLFHSVGPDTFRMYGKNDERYRIQGGNDLLPKKISAKIFDSIILNMKLTKLIRNKDKTMTLTFQTKNGIESITAERVVLALPFSVLRNIDYHEAGFSRLKCEAIQKLGMGSNKKVHYQFKTRHWQSLGLNGEAFLDRGYQSIHDVTRAQPGATGILGNYSTINQEALPLKANKNEKGIDFTELERIFPGISNGWLGRCSVDYWCEQLGTQGSYSYRKVGQFTKFAGVEQEVEEYCFFAGEHTSVSDQGTLNGAVESGERVAIELIQSFK
jgi:monoamine oxidase